MNTRTDLLAKYNIPDKLYFKIGEVSEIAGVPTYVLRFWENEFAKIKPKRAPSGQRTYRKQDVESVLLIKQLLYDKKYTIQGARQYLATTKKSPSKISEPLTMEEVRKELIRIRRLLDKK